MKWSAAAVVTATLALTGCGGGQGQYACTLIGCTSGVSIDIKGLPKVLPGARKLDVCVAGHCTHNTVYEPGRPEGKYVPKPLPFAEGEGAKLHSTGPYLVTVTVRDRRGRVLLSARRMVTMERFYPNGKGCDRVPCFVAGVKLDAIRQALEPLPKPARA